MSEQQTRTIRVLLIDDHVLFREGLVRLLEQEPDLEVAAHCGNVEDALGAIAAQSVDLVLLDFDLGLQRGTEFLTRAREQGHRTPTLVVTAGMSEEDAAAMLEAGISGIFLKRNSPTVLAKSIRQVMSGEAWIDSQYLGVLLRARPRGDRPVRFSERQRAVMRGVFSGLANKQIADRLKISETSVKASLQHLFSKTGVRTRSQLVRVVLEHYRDQI